MQHNSRFIANPFTKTTCLFYGMAQGNTILTYCPYLLFLRHLLVYSYDPLTRWFRLLNGKKGVELFLRIHEPESLRREKTTKFWATNERKKVTSLTAAVEIFSVFIKMKIKLKKPTNYNCVQANHQMIRKTFSTNLSLGAFLSIMFPNTIPRPALRHPANVTH